MAPLIKDNAQDTTHSNGVHVNQVATARIAIIGAGSRGEKYAQATTDSGLGTVVAVVEPIDFKRHQLGSKYIWGEGGSPEPGQTFRGWRDFVEYEHERRRNKAAGVDAVFVCVQDELHAVVVTALAPLGLHIMCEKPLATTLEDCLQIQRALQAHPARIFAIGHVLRYSPHNLLLRDLVLTQQAIGEVMSIEHTEPVGWWHFSHSYVRGHWRKESCTAPSLLTKSCHDIDWLLWMLCSPPAGSSLPPHLPDNITSMGSLNYFRRSKKPREAGNATNCLSCPISDKCIYSAKRIYYDRQLAKGDTRWPVDVVNPEIDTILATQGEANAKEALMKTLAEDYDASSKPVRDIESRPWFGRCVWESDNDVCDDQHVTMEWADDAPHGRSSKTASFHMIAHTLAQSDRRGWIYGSTGEIHYDSHQITLHDFGKNETRTYHPEVPKYSSHGGGDEGLTQQFLKAVTAVDSGQMDVPTAQVEFLDVTLEEAVRSHAVVFAAEDARNERRVVNWEQWWAERVGPQLQQGSKVH